ncbi:MAG TPA: enoyl-CoA hydratase/isomerase family protein, partial [Hellea balneolensis]|nr:enoyl-CoA hydratase/isomerase family protein [Hellea balneolensis]
FAMPETGIGYFPDVGGTYFLPRLGRAVGNWLGLTGARLKSAETCAHGIANVYIPSELHPAFVQALGKAELDGLDGPVMDVIKHYVRRPDLPENVPAAVSAFDKDTLPEIYAALATDTSDWAQEQLAFLKAKSPLAVYITFEALRRGARFDFRETMRQELDLSLNFLKIPDFYEGVRAAVIDKDRNPKWAANSIEDVNLDDVRRAFMPAVPELEFIRED